MKKTFNFWAFLKRYTVITFGVAIVALAVSIFYTPNKIVSGGVSGISTVLFHTLGIMPGISFFAINAVLLLLAWKFLGWRFVADTLYGAILLSVLVQVFSYLPPLTSDPLLATVFGALLYGVGIGLTLINGASTGGTDILARLVQCIFPHVKVGSLLLVVDAVVIGVSLVLFRNFDLTMYGIIALCISSFSINWLIRKLNVSKLAFVVTDKGTEIARYLVSHSPRGVTIVEATGGYTMQDKQVLVCALKESEAELFQKRILDLDATAFIIFSESSQIVGNGFRVYK
ncbi:MAG: YitT family protein [Clostridia bacterium]|nr:YitT family protein [Clostridia bacterium]